jgi:ABC-2 type transport system ATP-binding protein
VSELASKGTTVLLTTQYLEEADQLADRIVVIDGGAIVASGTADELKNALGRDVLEITVASADDLDRASSVMRGVSSKVAADTERRALSVRLPTNNGSALEALRLLDGAEIAVEDFQLRRPTLDEVFLAITGGREPQDEEGA